MNHLYRDALNINSKRIAELKQEFSEEVINRTDDGYFKYIINESIIRKIMLDFIKLGLIPDVVIPDLTVSKNEIQLAYRKRVFDLDVKAVSENYYLGFEMQTRSFSWQRFFAFWSAMAASQRKGVPTARLKLKTCVMVIISTVGKGYDAGFKSKDIYYTWHTFPSDVKGNILGKYHQAGLNIILIDLKQFKKQIANPVSFLEFFLLFLTCRTCQDLQQLFERDVHGIMKEVVRQDIDFLSGAEWEKYMELDKFYSAKFAREMAKFRRKARAEIRTEVKAEVEAEVEARLKAKVQAEVDEVKSKAKAEVDEAEARLKAKDEELRKLRALLGISSDSGVVAF